MSRTYNSLEEVLRAIKESPNQRPSGKYEILRKYVNDKMDEDRARGIISEYILDDDASYRTIEGSPFGRDAIILKHCDFTGVKDFPKKYEINNPYYDSGSLEYVDYEVLDGTVILGYSEYGNIYEHPPGLLNELQSPEWKMPQPKWGLIFSTVFEGCKYTEQYKPLNYNIILPKTVRSINSKLTDLHDSGIINLNLENVEHIYSKALDGCCNIHLLTLGAENTPLDNAIALLKEIPADVVKVQGYIKKNNYTFKCCMHTSKRSALDDTYSFLNTICDEFANKDILNNLGPVENPGTLYECCLWAQNNWPEQLNILPEEFCEGRDLYGASTFKIPWINGADKIQVSAVPKSIPVSNKEIKNAADIFKEYLSKLGEHGGHELLILSNSGYIANDDYTQIIPVSEVSGNETSSMIRIAMTKNNSENSAKDDSHAVTSLFG